MKQRNTDIDWIRAILIILMILIHIVNFGNGGYEFAMYNSGCKIGDANSSYYEMAGRHPNGKSVVQNGLF